MKILMNPLRGPCMFFYGSLREDLVKILLTSSRGPSMILYRSLCEDLDEVLVKSFLRGHCMILYRSFTESPCGDPSEILSTRSLHEDLADAMSHRCLYESSCGRLQQLQVLLPRSCEILLGVLA